MDTTYLVDDLGSPPAVHGGKFRNSVSNERQSIYYFFKATHFVGEEGEKCSLGFSDIRLKTYPIA